MSILKPEPNQVIGLLGGTFDPPHYGHLALAEAALTSGAVQQVRWIPAGQPPHRAGPKASAEHRRALVELLIAGRSEFSLDASEIEAAVLGQPSYTVLTLERLRRELGPKQPLAWIMGADAFLGLDCWHRWQELLGLCHLLITTRPGSTLSQAALSPPLQTLWAQARTTNSEALRQKAGGLLYCFTMPPQDISATALRNLLTQPDTHTDTLIPPTLKRYILQHQLYS